MTEMGYEYTELKDFIEDHGLPVTDLDFATYAFANKQSYKNPLFKKPVENSVNYDYYNVGAGAGLSMPPQSMAIGGNMSMNYDTNLSMMQPSEFDPEKDNCKICLNNRIDTVCIPCGHRCICDSCGQ